MDLSTEGKFRLDVLKNRCQFIEKIARGENLATEEEFLAHRPGGPKNPSKKLWGWITWYHHLGRFMERQQVSTPSEVAADLMMLEALEARPITIPIELPKKGVDEPKKLTIYAKSFHAITTQIIPRDLLLGAGATWLDTVRRNPTMEKAQWLLDVAEEISYQHRVMVWIMTSEQDIPFKGEREWKPAVPEWTKDLEPWAILRVIRAHTKVNGYRLMGAEALLDTDKPADGDSKRASWAKFFASMAMEMKVDPVKLMRNMPLSRVLGLARLSAQAREEAMADAKRKMEESDD